MDKKTYIGCSGYSYHEWKDQFYPENLASAERLAYYAEKFSTVEINSTFYHYPKAATLKKLYDGTPEDFRFSFKAGKQLTHIHRLKDCAEKVLQFSEHLRDQIGEKLLHILFQLPPSFAYSEENLQRVLEAIPHRDLNVVEFRHISWWNDTAFEEIGKAGITICNIDYPKLPKQLISSTGKFYMRFHGDPQLFKSNYPDPYLKNLVAELPEGLERYTFYFNNTMSNAAWKNAATLEELL